MIQTSEISKADIEDFDNILVMTSEHLSYITDHFNPSGNVKLLGEYLENSLEIPDPLGYGIEAYREIFSIIKGSIDRFLDVNGVYN